MRVVFVQRQTIWGGSVRSLYWLSSALAAEHEVYLAHFGEPTFASAYANAGIRLLPLSRKPFELTSLAKSVSKLPLRRGVPTLLALPRLAFDTAPVAARVADLLRELRPDIFHANQSLRINRAEILGAWLARVPVVSHLRGVHTLSRADRLVGGLADQFIAVSQASAASYAACGVPWSKLNVINNSIALPAVLAADERRLARETLGLEDPACWAVTCGRLIPRKGNREALEAVAAVRRRGCDLRLLVVGHGPEAPALAALARQLSIDHAVRFAGWQDDPVRHYLAADLLLLAAQLPEGFPRAIVEGMACGLPIVSTDTGGSREAFEPGVSGFLADGLGAEALADALEPLARDAALRRRMGESARREAARRYSPDKQVAAVLDVYERVIASTVDRRRDRVPVRVER